MVLCGSKSTKVKTLVLLSMMMMIRTVVGKRKLRRYQPSDVASKLVSGIILRR